MHDTQHTPKACRRLAFCTYQSARLRVLAPDHPDRDQLASAVDEAQRLPCPQRCERPANALDCAIADGQPLLPALRGEDPENEPDTIVIND